MSMKYPDTELQDALAVAQGPVMSKEEYAAAMKRIDELMDAQAGTPEAEELSALADQVMAYEEVHFPIDSPNFSCTCFDVIGEDPNCKLHHAES